MSKTLTVNTGKTATREAVATPIKPETTRKIGAVWSSDPSRANVGYDCVHCSTRSSSH